MFTRPGIWSNLKVVGTLRYLKAVMTFSKGVCEGVGFWSNDQHEKALECDFKKVSCWSLGQKNNGMGSVRWFWKNLKIEVFIGHFEFWGLRVVNGDGNIFNISYVKCMNGLWGLIDGGMGIGNLSEGYEWFSMTGGSFFKVGHWMVRILAKVWTRKSCGMEK